MILIACVDKNWGIGNKNNLLFKIKEDMKVFKEVTTNYGVVVMGRKTFESIGRLLPGRLNIILSRKPIDYKPTKKEQDIEYLCMPSVKCVLDYLTKHDLYKNTCIIGGQSVYEQFLDYCDEALITLVDLEAKEVDSFCPNLDDNLDWYIEELNPKNGYFGEDIKYKYILYKNENPFVLYYNR